MVATIIFRPLIILVLLVVSIIFILQNQQSLALVFFGTKTIQLSLAVWVLIFTGAGVFTSLLLQFLYRSFWKTIADQGKVNIPPRDPVSPARTQQTVREIFQQKKEPSDFRRFSETIPSPTDSKINSEWDRENQSREWDLETPPSEPTFIREQRKEVEPNLPQQSSSFEVQQQPKTTSRQGSVYSYSYKEAKPAEGHPPHQVYDANYRIITPPDGETSPKPINEEDEDWV